MFLYKIGLRYFLYSLFRFRRKKLHQSLNHKKFRKLLFGRHQKEFMETCLKNHAPTLLSNFYLSFQSEMQVNFSKQFFVLIPNSPLFISSPSGFQNIFVLRFYVFDNIFKLNQILFLK